MNLTSIFGANLSAFGFGSANVVAKKALEGLSILQTLLIGTSAGTILLAFITIIFGNPSILPTILFAGIGMAILEVCLYLVLYKSFAVADLTVAVSILSTYPVFTFLISVLILGEDATPIKFLFVLMIVFGATLTSIDWQGVMKDGFDKKDIAKGLGWVLITLAFHILYFPLLSVYTEDGDWETRLFLIKSISLIILSSLFLIQLKKNKEKIPPFSKILPTSALGVLEVVGWIGLGLAYASSINQVGTVIALSSTAPLFTAIGAYIFLKERLKILQYVGVAITLFGIIAMSL